MLKKDESVGDVLVAMNKADLLEDDAFGAQSNAFLLLRESFSVVDSHAQVSCIDPDLVHFTSTVPHSTMNGLSGKDDRISNLCSTLEDQIIRHLNLGAHWLLKPTA